MCKSIKFSAVSLKTELRDNNRDAASCVGRIESIIQSIPKGETLARCYYELLAIIAFHSWTKPIDTIIAWIRYKADIFDNIMYSWEERFYFSKAKLWERIQKLFSPERF